ncbi:MAG: SpoIIE family protein phosphatase [Mycobacterium sp.]
MGREDSTATLTSVTLPSPSAGPAIRVFTIVFAAYVAGAVASALAFGSTTASAFFPPGGITVAALLLTRRSLWPVIMAAVVGAELLVDRISGLNWAISAGFTLGNAVEALVGAALVFSCCGGTPDLRRTRDLSIYVFGAAVVGALCGGLIGGATKWWAFGVPLIQGVTQWFAGDAISVLVIGTSILLWSKQSHILRSRPLETAVILTAAAVLSVIGFITEIPPGTTVLPILAVAALRLGVLGTALTGVVVAAISNYLTGRHLGLLGTADTADPLKVAMAQCFVAVLVLTAMVIAQEVSKRTTAVLERDVERGERRRVESLSGLAQELSAALTPTDVGRALENRLPGDLGATAFDLGLRNHESLLEWVASMGDPDEPSVAAEVMQSGTPVVLDTDSGSLAGWPLFSADRVTGVLLVGFTGAQPLDSEQLTYISAVAAMVGEALARAQSYADEHARAAVLHAALHPASPATTAGIQYCVSYEPADIVHGLGGDFYDVMSLPDNRTYLAVGDIVGHGLQAVEDMAQLRGAGRTLAHRGQPPARVLADLNNFAEDVIRSEFATMVAAVYDHAARTLTYSSAGHPPAFLRKAGTGEVIQLDDATGSVLGPVKSATFTDGIIAVDPGDTLMMYTDGLVERPGLVVSAGIARAARLVAEWPAEELLDCQAITERLVPTPRSDDICVLVVRFD